MIDYIDKDRLDRKERERERSVARTLLNYSQKVGLARAVSGPEPEFRTSIQDSLLGGRDLIAEPHCYLPRSVFVWNIIELYEEGNQAILCVHAKNVHSFGLNNFKWRYMLFKNIWTGTQNGCLLHHYGCTGPAEPLESGFDQVHLLPSLALTPQYMMIMLDPVTVFPFLAFRYASTPL